MQIRRDSVDPQHVDASSEGAQPAGAPRADAPDATVLLPRVAILGLGSLGGAILSGLRSPGVATDGPVIVTTRSRESASVFDGASDVHAIAVADEPDANRIAAEHADLVLLAVKPQHTVALAREIAPALRPGTVVISVAAGVSLAAITAVAPEGVTVVRSMPNTPSHIGRGVTGLSADPSGDPAALDLARQLFETVGDVLCIPESQMDALCAISGSGPAYVFWFAEQFVQAAERLGFSASEARTLAQGTLVGAANLLDASDLSPSQLRQNVTSPGGTTEAAMREFLAADIPQLFDRAVGAAKQRSAELDAETKTTEG